MGFLDTVLGWFGVGGASLAMDLDVEQVPQGGVVSGKVTITGGKNPQEVKTVKVRLLHVSVTKKDDSPLPDIDTTILFDNTIATGKSTGPGKEETFEFSVTIPADVEPTAHNVSYTVQAQADIPGAKDPTAKKELKVLEGGGATADDLYTRWPALRGTEEEPLLDALRDMRWKHDRDEEDGDLIVAEPILTKLAREGSPRVALAALEAMVEIVDDRVKADHVRLIMDVDDKANLDKWQRRSLIRVASSARKYGGMTMVKKYATHDDPEWRAAAAESLSGWSDFIGPDLELLRTMVEDDEPRVRAAVLESLGSYDQNMAALELIASKAATETVPSVQRACLSGLSSLVWRDRLDLALPLYIAFSKSDDAELRADTARRIPSSSAIKGNAELREMIDRLLADPEETVRDAMAFELNNLVSTDAELYDVAVRVVREEASQKVRGSAVSALPNVEDIGKALAFYTELLDGGEANTKVLKGMVFGLRFKDAEGVKPLLERLAGSTDPEVAQDAKEALADD